MQKKRIGSIIIVISLALSSLASMGLLYYAGILADNGYYIPDFLRISLFITTPSAALCAIIFFFRTISDSDTKIEQILYGMVDIISLILIVLIVVFLNVTNIIPITLDQLEDDIINNASGMYYIERDDCSACASFFPLIEKQTKHYLLPVYSYSTSQDRDTGPDKLYEILDSLGVKAVPSIVVLENGGVVTLLEGDNIAANFRDYLRATYG